MNIWIKRGLQMTACAGGLWALSAGIAAADTAHQHPTTHRSIIAAPINLPVTISGNSINVLGHGRPTSARSHAAGSAPTDTTGHRRSIVSAPVNAPVTVSGNSVAVLGRSNAHSSAGSAGGSSGASTTGRSVVRAPVNAPVTVSGNSVAVFGSQQRSRFRRARQRVVGREPDRPHSGARAGERTGHRLR